MLEKLRQMRLQQLQQAASAKRTTAAATRLPSSFQAGTLVDATISELADILEAASASASASVSAKIINTASPIVCHFALEGSPIDDQADELLSSLAHQYPKTHFLRVILPPGGFSTTGGGGGGGGGNIGLAPGLSGVLCCSGDSIITAPLSLFSSVGSDEEEEEEEEDLDEEALERWLEKQGVLVVRDCGSEDGVGSSEEEEGEEEKYDPCEVCGRCYPHQHVRSVTRRGTDGVL